MPDNLLPPADGAPAAESTGGPGGGDGRRRQHPRPGADWNGAAPGTAPVAEGRAPEPEPDRPIPAGNGPARRVGPGAQPRARARVSTVRRQRRAKSRQRALIEWVVAVGLAVLAAFLIKTWLVQAFVIPSGSMRPALEVDDRVLVSKLTYRLGEPGRGDVIVFDNPARLPGEPAQLIKRVVAVEGDEVETVDGQLVINDQPADEPYLRPGTTTRGRDGADLEPEVVPEDHVYVMGDNRSDSRDSRFLGPISTRHVVGQAFFRLWPLGRLGRL